MAKKRAAFGRTRYYRVNHIKQILWKGGYRFKHECNFGGTTGVIGAAINEEWETFRSYKIVENERRGGLRANSGRPLSASKNSAFKLKAPDILVNAVRGIDFRAAGFAGIGDYLSLLVMGAAHVTDEIYDRVGSYGVDRQVAISRPAMIRLRELHAEVEARSGESISLGCVLTALWLAKNDGLGRAKKGRDFAAKNG